MPNPYEELLEATIAHVERMKSRGARFLTVSTESLALLSAIRSPAAGRSVTRKVQGNAQRTGSPTPAMPSRETAVVEKPPGAPGPEIGIKILASSTVTPERAAAFDDLRRRVLVCIKCAHLAASRRNVVFGVGNPAADLMFVGEAPGAEEDEQAEPFVGRAGQLLTRIIQAMGLTRDSVYIANILKCRPDTPGQSAGNRKPTPEEMQTCIPFLHEQIDLIEPKVIVALGATAVEGLLGKTAGISRVRGNWRTYRGIPLMPTFHPSFLLRPGGASSKRLVWEDMMQVMQELGMPISEKQRNYFLKASGG